MYRYLIFLDNPVPHSNLLDPRGGSLIYESGTGGNFVFIFLRGYRSIIFNPDLKNEILFLLRICSFGTKWSVIDPKINFGSSFFLWVHSVGFTNIILSLFRIRECFHKFCVRILTPKLAIFLVWGDYRCPRPELEFYASFRSETPVFNPRAPY